MLTEKIPGMWWEMHNRTKEGEKKQNLARRHWQTAKREWENEWGRLKMRRPGFIEAVGSPSRRFINPVQMRVALEICGHVTRVRTCNLAVQPLEPRASGRVTEQSGRLSHTRPDTKRSRPNDSHWKRQKLRKNLQKLFFLRSASKHACIINW